MDTHKKREETLVLNALGQDEENSHKSQLMTSASHFVSRSESSNMKWNVKKFGSDLFVALIKKPSSQEP